MKKPENTLFPGFFILKRKLLQQTNYAAYLLFSLDTSPRYPP